MSPAIRTLAEDLESCARALGASVQSDDLGRARFLADRILSLAEDLSAAIDREDEA